MTGDQLVADLFGHVNWDRKAKPTIQSVDQRVHSDHFAVDVAKRAAAVAGIDRGIGLQIIRDRVTARREQFAAPFAADDAVSKRIIELERRADCEGKLAHAHCVAVAELHDWQIFRVDFDHRDIGLLVRADDLGRKFAAILQFHLNFVGCLHHMKICEDVTVRPDDESRAFALDGLKISRISLGIIFVRRTLEK